MIDDPSTEVELVVPAEAVPSPGTDAAYRTLSSLAHTLARAGELIPRALQDRPEAIMAAILMGRELGLGDMIALQRIHVIQGQVTLSADLVRALIRRGGHSLRYDVRDAETCTLTGTRADTGDTLTVTWTIHDARAAGLVEWWERWSQDATGRKTKEVWIPGATERPDWIDNHGRHRVSDAWVKYPRAMLDARSTTEIGRALFSDCIGWAAYAPEDFDAHTD